MKFHLRIEGVGRTSCGNSTSSTPTPITVGPHAWKLLERSAQCTDCVYFRDAKGAAS